MGELGTEGGVVVDAPHDDRLDHAREVHLLGRRPEVVPLAELRGILIFDILKI